MPYIRPQTTLMSVNMPCVEPVGPGCLSSTASVPPLSEESRTLASGLLKIHVCFLSYSGYSPVTSIMKWMTDLGRRANLVTKTRSRHLQNIPGSSLSKNVSCSALAAFLCFCFFLHLLFVVYLCLLFLSLLVRAFAFVSLVFLFLLLLLLSLSVLFASLWGDAKSALFPQIHLQCLPRKLVTVCFESTMLHCLHCTACT